MPYNQKQQRNLFSQDDPFETTEEAMRKMYRQEPYSVPITDGLSVTPLLSYDKLKQAVGTTDININSRSFGAGLNTDLGTFRAAKNLVNVDVDSLEGQEEFKGKGYSLGYSKFNKKGYGVTLDVGIQPMPEGVNTSWQAEAKAYWDSGELLGTILKTFKNLAD